MIHCFYYATFITFYSVCSNHRLSKSMLDMITERSVGGSRAKSPPVESPRRRKASEAATREIAGGGNDTPKLVQITRIDSWGRAEMAERVRQTNTQNLNYANQTLLINVT